MTWLKRAWATVKRFVSKHWRLLVGVAVAVVVYFLWRKFATRLSFFIDGLISRPAKWSKIPGVQTHVVAINPNSGDPETVELPAGVKARDVESVGISTSGGTYEIAKLHNPDDRRVDGDASHDLSIS